MKGETSSWLCAASAALKGMNGMCLLKPCWLDLQSLALRVTTRNSSRSNRLDRDEAAAEGAGGDTAEGEEDGSNQREGNGVFE